jgi:hypothetical protein
VRTPRWLALALVLVLLVFIPREQAGEIRQRRMKQDETYGNFDGKRQRPHGQLSRVRGRFEWRERIDRSPRRGSSPRVGGSSSRVVQVLDGGPVSLFTRCGAQNDLKFKWAARRA